MPQDHSFGKAKRDPNEWNAAMCLTGMPDDAKLLEPDRDLGRCVKTGCRNVVRSDSDRDRIFGVPTIRLDIPQKAQKSVADH